MKDLCNANQKCWHIFLPVTLALPIWQPYMPGKCIFMLQYTIHMQLFIDFNQAQPYCIQQLWALCGMLFLQLRYEWTCCIWHFCEWTCCHSVNRRNKIGWWEYTYFIAVCCNLHFSHGEFLPLMLLRLLIHEIIKANIIWYNFSLSMQPSYYNIITWETHSSMCLPGFTW